MTKRFWDAHWKALLPDAYAWVEKLSISEVNSESPATTYLVPVKTSQDKTDSSQSKIKLKTDVLSQKTEEALLQKVTELGWDGKSSYFQIATNDAQYFLIPITKIKTSTPQIARQWGLDAARVIKHFSVDHLVICPQKNINQTDVLDGFFNGFYQMKLFSGKRFSDKAPKNKFPTQVSLWEGHGLSHDDIDHVKIWAKASYLVRMIQDAPPNWLTPQRFADIAKDISKDLGLKCTLRSTDELQKLGAEAFLSVARGSQRPPYLITIEIEGSDNAQTICLVGKGLTFDAGGISLKPSLGMGEMKYDMCGGAAVLGAAYVLGQLNPPVKVVCIIGAVENMPGSTATHPSDIVTAVNGKTIDIQNTDAEGRLVLADCLSFAIKEFKPSFIIDVATLTGAVLHALGSCGAAIMTNQDDMAQFIEASSQRVGEPLWRLPLWPELKKEIRSDIADLQNIAKPNVLAGTIIGGIFLSEFVEDTPWVHMDIAGTGWNCKATGYPHSGGSAFATRTLVDAVMRYENS